ncbi:hypothetical protein B0H12DRAFT_1083201, partial [Mycena haematopus]
MPSSKKSRCPHCFRSVRGVNNHIAKTPACHAKWVQSLAGDTAVTVGHDNSPPPRTPSPVPSDDAEDDPMGLADDFIPAPPENTPPPPEPIARPRRATVEEVLDEDDPQNFKRFVEPYENEESLRPAAGGHCDGEKHSLRECTQKSNLSFHNNRSFLLKVDKLPTGPDWTCKIVTAAGNRLDENDELMSEDLELWMRNPVECIKELISNPAFASTWHMHQNAST